MSRAGLQGRAGCNGARASATQLKSLPLNPSEAAPCRAEAAGRPQARSLQELSAKSRRAPWAGVGGREGSDSGGCSGPGEGVEPAGGPVAARQAWGQPRAPGRSPGRCPPRGTARSLPGPASAECCGRGRRPEAAAQDGGGRLRAGGSRPGPAPRRAPFGLWRPGPARPRRWGGSAGLGFGLRFANQMRALRGAAPAWRRCERGWGWGWRRVRWVARRPGSVAALSGRAGGALVLRGAGSPGAGRVCAAGVDP